MKDELSQAIVRLFEQERFYAELVLQMDRYISNKVPTAGVCVKDRIQLHINPAYFSSLMNGQNNTNDEQVAVLKHECKHILNDHIPRSKELAPEVYAKKQDAVDSLINGAKHQLINIAADCSINPGIPGLPEKTVNPGQFGLEDGHLMEWYVANLKGHEKLKELTEIDGHSLWAESDGDKDEVKEKIRNAVMKAAKNTKAHGGHLSADVEMLVDRLTNVPKDWKSDLRRFAARTQEVALRSSKKKRNRRYGITYPGVVKEETLSLACCVDTSGSMSHEALSQIAAELCALTKTGTTIWVIEADCEVKNVWKFDTKKLTTFNGGGGTAYGPALEYAENELDVDGIIYFGDFDTSDTPKKPRTPVLWAGVNTTQNPPVEWGGVTRINVTSKS